MTNYTLMRRLGWKGSSRHSCWIILSYEEGQSPIYEAKSVWQRTIFDEDEDTGEYSWPEDMRKEYERLTGKSEFGNYPTEINIVELIAGEDCAWDQPCKYGYRVETHAVYCHNENWLYSPNKCHRNRSDFRHENCPGFCAQ